MNRTLLIVDDEESILHSLIRLFRNEGYYLLTANNGEAALRLLAQNEVHVILTDQRMPGMNGDEFLAKARELYPDSVRLMLSGYADATAIADAVNKGNIYRFLFKPWSNEVLLATVREAFERFDLGQQGSRFSMIYENAVEGIIITDRDAIIQAVNPAFSLITGYQADEAIGRKPTLLKSGQHDAGFYREMWAALHKHGKWTGEIWNRRKNGEVYPQRLNITAIRDGEGKVFQYLGLFSDIAEQKRNEERLRHYVYHDALTDLPNRMLLSESLETAISQAERMRQQVALLMLDLDHFKQINDSHGQELGDGLLVLVAERLRSAIRKGDILARVERDEFALLLPLVLNASEVIRVIEKITREFARPFMIGKTELAVTASIGVSIYPQDGATAEELLKNVDGAMCKAKNEGRNTYVFFTPAMTEMARERIVVENDLRRALNAGEIEIFFQPELQLGNDRVVAVEALARWNHASRGMVLPKDFIAVAEDAGLIVGLGKLVLEDACRRMAGWRRDGDGELRVSVNLSAAQFRDAGLFETINRTLEQTGLDPRSLELELSENTIMRNAETSIELLLMLKRLGVRIAVDNFGTGYSPLSYMKRLPVDVLKIDGSFVRNITSDPHDAEMVRTIIRMAHSFRLEVVAEGVETAEQLDFLRQIGCDVIQGYGFAPPMPAADIDAFLKKRAGAGN